MISKVSHPEKKKVTVTIDDTTTEVSLPNANANKGTKKKKKKLMVPKRLKSSFTSIKSGIKLGDNIENNSKLHSPTLS